MSPQPWKRLHSENVFNTRYVRVRRDTCRLPDQSVIDDYFVVERDDIVGVVAITNDNMLVTNIQYKHGIGEIVREIIGGFVDPGEDPRTAAIRELEEETGFRVNEQHLTLLQTLIASPTTENNRYHVFLAEHVEPIGKKMLDPREEIINECVPLSDVPAMIAAGEINVLWSLSALYLASKKLPMLRL